MLDLRLKQEELHVLVDVVSWIFQKNNTRIAVLFIYNFAVQAKKRYGLDVDRCIVGSLPPLLGSLL